MSPIVQKLRMALARYESADAECPARKTHLGEKPCPKCGSAMNEGCSLDIAGAYALIHEVRSICEEAEKTRPAWRELSLEERPY